MTLIHYFRFFGFLMYAYLAGFILYKGPKSMLNISCSLLLSSFAIWNIGDTFSMDKNITKDTVVLFQNISSIGWICFASLFLWFSMFFSKKEKLLKNKWFLFFSVILPVILIYKQWTISLTSSPVLGAYGWEVGWKETFWTYLFYAYYISFVLLGVYTIHWYGIQTKRIIEKRQSEIMVSTVIISLVVGTITDIILPLFHIRGIPPIGNIILLVFAGGMIYAIEKYKLLVATPAIAADNIISTMEELLILTDHEGNILKINKAVIDSMKYEQKDLSGKSVAILFRESSLTIPLLARITRGEIIKNQEAYLLMKDATEIPVIFSCSPLKDKEGDIRGIVFVANDITERKQAQEQLQLFRSLLDQSADAIFVVDAATSRFLDVNEQACRSLQYSRGEILQRRVLDIQTAMRDDVAWQSHVRELSSKGKLLIGFEALRKDGTCFLVEVNTRFVEIGGKAYIISVVRDITGRRHAEDAILKANRQHAVISHINKTIVRTGDRDQLFGDVCRIAIEYGKFQLSWIGLVDEETKLVNPVVYAGIENGYLSKAQKISVSDLPEGRGPNGTALREGKYFVCNDIANDPAMSPWKDEAIRNGYRSSIAFPIKPFGKVIGAFSLYASVPHFFDLKEIEMLDEAANDISFCLETIETERRRVESEEALLHERALLRTVIDNVPDLIYAKDRLCRKTLANIVDVRAMGAKSDADVLGKDDFAFYPKELAEGFFNDDQMVIQKGVPVLNREEYVIDEKGEKKWLLTSKLPLRDKDDQIIGLVGIGRDFTDRWQAEQELIIAKEKAEESDRLKSSFLANISHEFRTPMNGILGFAEILKESDLTGEQQREYISIIEKNGARMLNIINDIVDISKIESAQMNVFVSEININELIEYVYNLFRPEAEQKGIQIFFKNHLPANEAIIKTDRAKVDAILSNLVKNAIKFTSQGCIEFGCGSTGSPTDSSITELTVFVKDTGIGIHPEHQGFIFEKFRQGSESLNKKYEGAGLGLAISKAYVEMLGGKIWVESEEGKGSTFYFTVPRPK